MKQIVVVRQQPSIGDAILLSPLISAIKNAYPKSNLTVVTDSAFSGGALIDVFEHILGVDRVEAISPVHWVPGQTYDIPPTIKKSNKVFDCNSAFLNYEAKHGWKPPLGISKFWVEHFEFDSNRYFLPTYTFKRGELDQTVQWFRDNHIEKPSVGVVLRAGHPARDWNYNGLAGTICDWLYTSGYQPIGIDPVYTLPHVHTIPFVGKRIKEVAGLLRVCQAVITPDTGLLHLAQAVGTPTVALWGIMPPELRTEGYSTLIVPSHPLGCCTMPGCYCHSMAQQWSCPRLLKPDMIVSALKRILDAVPEPNESNSR